MLIAVLTLLGVLVVVALGYWWADARRQLAADDVTPPVPLEPVRDDPHVQRIDSLESAVRDLRQQITPPRQIPVVELWLMDRDEKTIEHTLHVATRLRDPEVYVGGMLYRAARETQPGYWIYRRTV